LHCEDEIRLQVVKDILEKKRENCILTGGCHGNGIA
jgi:hypothetical protein